MRSHSPAVSSGPREPEAKIRALETEDSDGFPVPPKVVPRSTRSPVTPETTSVPQATDTVKPTAGDTSAPKGGYPARAKSSKGKRRGATFALGDPALEETLRQKDSQSRSSVDVVLPPPPEKPKSAVDVIAPPAHPKSSPSVTIPEPQRAPPMRETRTFETQSAAKLTETRVDAETAAELLKADVAPLTAFVAVDDSRREIARQSKGVQANLLLVGAAAQLLEVHELGL